MREAPIHYRCEGGAGDRALAAAAGAPEVPRTPPTTHSTTYLDTFDWRLFRAGVSLAASAEPAAVMLRWCGLDGTPSRRLRLAGPPGFAADLPPGPFRDALGRLTGIRRLLPVVSVRAELHTAQVLDDRGKTVARLELTRGGRAFPGAAGDAEGHPLPDRLTLLPVRGYPEASDRLAALLGDEPGLTPTAIGELGAALAAVGRTPGDYSSKLQLRLDPEQSAGAALQEVLRALFTALCANEAGLRRDLDPEFLHDFRVAVRRTRSALGQVKGVYPPAARDPLRSELSWLGRTTGPTRDLDVYRLRMEDYRGELPAAQAAALDPLEEYLRRHQCEEHRRLVAALDSPRYRDLLAAWSAFLEAPPAASREAPDAGRPVTEVAGERIWKAWRRLLQHGRRITDQSPAEALHRLRIDAKKLRYLLEFFRSLFDAGAVERPLGALKKLQDNLGDFNDLAVQRRALGRFAEAMASEGLAPPATLLAMGRLQAVLERRQGAERERFAKRFARLASGKTRHRVHALFAPSDPGEGA